MHNASTSSGQYKIMLVSVVALLAVIAAVFVKDHKRQLFGKLVHSINTEDKIVALTFDDGPTPERTQRILEILASEDVIATFYLNGRPMAQNPAEAKLLVSSGHEIGNHSYSHKRMLLMSYDAVAREVERTDDILRSLGYQREIRFRPPYGKSLFSLPYYLARRGMTTVTWDVEPETFQEGQDSPENITRRAIEGTKPGSIILLHVMYGDGSSMAAVRPIINGLRERGYRFVTIDEMLTFRDSR